MPELASDDMDGPPPSKISRSDLYKPPTNEELADLRETEMLFHSNLVRLQISETLKEISLSQTKRAEIDTFLHSIHNAIMKIPSSASTLLQKPDWLHSSVSMPVVRAPSKVKGNMPFHPPTEIKLVGSYQLDTILKQKLNIDLLLLMPAECFQAKDHLNQRYFRKRALYLSHVAYHLSNSCQLVGEVKFSYFLDDIMKPVVLVQPADFLAKSLMIRLHAGPGEEVLKMDRFNPVKSNLRQSWLFGLQNENEKDLVSTPHYNSAVLVDVLMESHLYFLFETCKDFQAFKDAVKLLKVWLHQRSLDEGYGSFSGFLMSMLLAYLLSINKINKLMSCYQIVRNAFQYLANSNWTSEGISFTRDEDFSIYHQHFEVVFIDPTGKLNLCANMPALLYNQVCHEAKLSLEALDNKQSGFSAVFLQPVHLLCKFDQTIEFSKPGVLRKTCEKLGLQKSLLDHSGNCLAAMIPYLAKLLQRGLSNRAHHVGIKTYSFQPWDIAERPPLWKEVSQNLVFGIILNREASSDVLERGPSADFPEAAAFREFWGDRSELRRFKDGAICEAVVWNCANEAEKREIPLNICKYLLKKHLDLSHSAVTTTSSQFEDFLKIPQRVLKGGLRVGYIGTGDEINLNVVLSYNELCQKLRSLDSLPLSISNIQGISPVLRYTEVFPPWQCNASVFHPSITVSENQLQVPIPNKKCPPYLSPIEVICHMEGSGKWPQQAEALRRLKAAFHLTMSDELKRKNPELVCVPTQNHFDVMTNGFLFRICVAYQREITVLETVKTPEGMIKIKSTPQSLALAKRTLHLPQLTSALHGLRSRFPGFSDACRLSKRWLNAHMLTRHVTVEAIELAVASLFVNPYPFAPPGTGQVGFLRFLRFLSSFDFVTNPLIVDINNEMKSSDVDEILNNFKENRQTLPPLTIMTSQDRTRSMWSDSKPSKVVLRRVRDLARVSLEQAESCFLKRNDSPGEILSIFTPALSVYDALIRLKARWLPRRHEQVTRSLVGAERKQREIPEFEGSYVFPVADFDPVQLYLEDLEESFGDLAMFFHDVNGGDVIGVVWRPKSFEPKPFKILNSSCVEIRHDGKCSPNVKAILEDFKTIGRGLVDNIEVDFSKWKI